MRQFILFLFLVLSPFTLLAGVVKGVVRDSMGQPLPYVIVAVKNSSYGVNTSLNGAYFLELKPGNYTLVFSQLGYTKQEHNITVKANVPTVLDVTLRMSAKELETFEVKAHGDRDKGKEIMKQVIDHRSEYWDRVQNYQCNTYQKNSLERILIDKTGADTLPKKTEVNGAVKIGGDSVTVAVKETSNDTTGKKKNKKDKKKTEEDLDAFIKNKQINLVESVSQTFFRRPTAFKENVLGYHDFAAKKPQLGGGASESFEYGEHEIAPVQYSDENPYLLITDAPSSDFNFYRNEIYVPSLCTRPLLSPAAGTAFLNYRFEFMGSFVENGKTIHQISVLPLFKQDALFSGYLFIEDSTWAIVSVNLSISPGVLLFCREFSVIEDYSQVAPDVFLPVRQEFNYTIHDGKYNFIGNARVDRSDYVVNGPIPDKTFNDEVKHFSDDAYDKDSAYWVEHRTIELEEKETKYIHTVDSLVAYYQSPKFLSSEDSAYNHINIWSFVLNGVGHRNRVRGTEFFIDPIVQQMQFFGVGGYHHRLGGHFNKDFTNGMLLETDGQADYGFLNKDVHGKVGVGLTYYPLRFVRTFVRFGDYYEMINTYASLESIFSRSNYVRTKQFSIAQRMEIVNGLFGEFTFEHSDQLPINDIKLEAWSQQVFGNLNTPLDFERYIKSEVRLELKYRFRQKYIIKNHRKIIVGTKFPEVRFLYRKGIPGLLNSEINYDYIEFGSADEIKLGRFGTSNWSLLAGAFVQKKDLRLLEYKYFRGSDSYIFSDPMHSFQLLGPTLNTANAYFRLNYIHHFEGCFGTKIPLYNRLKITTSVGGGLLMIPDKNFYHEEFFVGLERIVRIKKQLFRFGIFAVTADNNISKAAITYKVGLSFYDPMTRKWSY